MNPGSPAQAVDPLSFAEDGAFGSESAPPLPTNTPWIPRRITPLNGIFSPAAARARTVPDIPTEHRGHDGETTRYDDPGSCPNCGQRDHLGRFGSSDRLTFHMTDTLDRECPIHGGLQNGKRDDGMTSERKHRREDDGKDNEPARMEIYVPDPSGIGMQGGGPADGRVGSIDAREKGTNGEEQDKAATTEDLSSGPQRDTSILILVKTQLLEMTTNRINEREQVVIQDANDPASTPSKRKYMSTA